MITTGTRFVNSLIVKNIDGRNAALMYPLRFYSDRMGKMVVAPAGFVTDWASIPLLLTGPLIPKNGGWDFAAVIHDAAYRGEIRNEAGHHIHLTKEEADYLFLDGMACKKVGFIRRWTYYLAVHWFGRGKFTARRREGPKVVH